MFYFRTACVSFVFHSSVVESSIGSPRPPHRKWKPSALTPVCFSPGCLLPLTYLGSSLFPVPWALAPLHAHRYAILWTWKALGSFMLLSSFSCSLSYWLRHHFLQEAELSASSSTFSVALIKSQVVLITLKS